MLFITQLFKTIMSSSRELLKVLGNENTLLRAHALDVSCAAQTGKNLLRTQNVSEQNEKHFFASQTQNLCCNKCCARGQTGKHLCRQQCARNNVSSFARALRERTKRYNVSWFCQLCFFRKSVEQGSEVTLQMATAWQFNLQQGVDFAQHLTDIRQKLKFVRQLWKLFSNSFAGPVLQTCAI